MNQKLLFPQVNAFPARARRDDPATSHRAADRVNETGTAITHRQRIMNTLEHQTGLTCAEIARKSGLSYHQVQRRMRELQDMGFCSTIGQRNRQRVWTEVRGQPEKIFNK